LYLPVEHYPTEKVRYCTLRLSPLRRPTSPIATYVAKLLQGAKAAELPIEQAERFHLVINLKTANALGLKMQHRYSRRPTR
jgi:hypothetical protein